MTHLDVFDPPMCCSSGVCGPSVDPLLAAFAADVDWLLSQGVTVTRHNLAQDPHAFLAQPDVEALLQREGTSCLPLLLVDGAIVGQGRYPRREELAHLTRLTASASRTTPRIHLSSACGCKPKSGCC